MLIKGRFEFLGLFTKILHRLANTANILGRETKSIKKIK